MKEINDQESEKVVGGSKISETKNTSRPGCYTTTNKFMNPAICVGWGIVCERYDTCTHPGKVKNS